MLATYDTETRGLFGKIFRVGYYDKVNGYKNFYNGIEFFKHIMEIAKGLPEKTVIRRKKEVIVQDTLYVYCFNLEFDFKKILAEFRAKRFKVKIDYNNSLIIDGKFHNVKIEDMNIIFCDLYPIVQCSLDQASKSFDLDVKKLEIKGSKDEYFKKVSADDKELCEYLKADVLSTYELLTKIMNMSMLVEDDFVRCPTVASLSMRIFRTNMPDDYETIKNSTLSKDQEEFVRKGYHGGRCEVYKNIISNGYHYDVNSLYPSVMQDNFYPTGAPFETSYVGEVKNNRTSELLTEDDLKFIKDHFDKNKLLYMLECTVFVPNTLNIPVLPLKHDNKLLFPTGIFRGIWTNIELDYAIQQGCSITQMYKFVGWEQKDKVFNKFVTYFRDIKENSEGAKRTFAKYIQNALYGKFGMIRNRICYENWNEEKSDRIQNKGELCAKVCTILEQYLLKFTKVFFADYIRPQFSAFVTSYARLNLVQQMHKIESRNGRVYYCDTDSVVCDKEIENIYVHKSEYGKWKLERNIEKGIYILPKLYAEFSVEGEEVLKSKGIVKDYLETVKYDDYYKYYDYMVRGQNLTLYDENSKTKYYTSRKILNILINESLGFDDKVLIKKRFLFSNINIHKRIFDFINNTSKPLNILNND